MIATTPTIVPTAIPAFAPPDRPSLGEEVADGVGLLELVFWTFVAVGVGVEDARLLVVVLPPLKSIAVTLKQGT